jgi:CelD/BcsL family acetyltransferase involved in cellulose biosynthesis
VSYAIEPLDAQGDDWLVNIDSTHAGTIYQTPAWVRFLSQTQRGEPVVAALKSGRETIGYFTGLIVRKFGLRILGSPFAGWSTDYMGFALPPSADRRQAVQAVMDYAFHDLRCVHLEVMDRNVTVRDLDGLGVQYRIYRGFEIDLGREEHEVFSGMTSACRRCIRKADKEGVFVEEAKDIEFADEYYAQLKDVFAKRNLVPTYGIQRVRHLITHLQPTGHLLLLRARDRSGRCIATGIFPHMNGVMYFWGGASWRHHQKLRPNEAIQWHAMRIARQKGLRVFDMGGGGEYKRKYGGYEIEVPWFRKSKYAWIHHLREIAQRSHKVRQYWLGQFNRLHGMGMDERAKRMKIESVTE